MEKFDYKKAILEARAIEFPSWHRYFRHAYETVGAVVEQMLEDWHRDDPKAATFYEWDDAQDGGDFEKELQERFLSAWSDDAEVSAAARALFALYNEEGGDPDGEATIDFYVLLQSKGYETMHEKR